MLRRVLPILLLAGALGLAACGGGSSGDKQVTLALDFTPNAAHAGIYEAVADKRDKAHGVKLVVRQPSASTDSLKLLASGKADMAVVDIHDLGLAREKGQDLVGVGALVQEPLAAVIARSTTRRPRALEGKRVGVTGLPSDNAVLRAVVQGDGGDYSKVKKVTIGFTAVPTLAAGKVAAVTAFWNVEGVALRARGVRTSEFRVSRFGAPRYPELVLVVRRAELDKQRAKIRAALAAIEDGTRQAIVNPVKALDAIQKASGASRGLVLSELVNIRPALSPPVRLQPASLAGWARFDTQFGILSKPPDVASAFDTRVAP
ncbi:MAG: ABC transporter substrate-binding protein [Thermoleophilaceae bacterium]